MRNRFQPSMSRCTRRYIAGSAPKIGMSSPGKQPPTVGTVSEFRMDPIGRMREWARETDTEVVHVSGSEREHYVVFHPDLIEKLFFERNAHLKKHMVGATSVATKSIGSVYGDQWRAQRSVQQPHFGPEQIHSYSDTFRDVATAIVGQIPENEAFDLHQLLKRASVRMLLETVLGDTDVDDSLLECADVLTEWHHTRATRETVPEDVQTRFEALCASLTKRIDTVLAEVGPQTEGRGLAPTLLAAGPDSEAAYTTDRIRDELLAKLFSGHRTTAQSWTYTLFLVAGTPAVERRVLDELASVTDGEPPGPAHVDDLSFLERTIRESLRLHPPTTAQSRVTTTDLTLDGYTLPSQSVVYLPQVIVHRDGRWWDEPDTFRPDRFESDGPSHSLAYFPFGAGPRRCLGERFAIVQAKVVVATLLSAYRFERVSDPATLTPSPSGVLSEPVRFRARPQSSSPFV